ncbi:MAG: hypothetical protein ABI587_05705 [Gemmatimonadales bacterium]
MRLAIELFAASVILAGAPLSVLSLGDVDSGYGGLADPVVPTYAACTALLGSVGLKESAHSTVLVVEDDLEIRIEIVPFKGSHTGVVGDLGKGKMIGVLRNLGSKPYGPWAVGASAAKPTCIFFLYSSTAHDWRGFYVGPTRTTPARQAYVCNDAPAKEAAHWETPDDCGRASSPSPSGKGITSLLGIDVVREYFEDLPKGPWVACASNGCCRIA